MFDGVFPLGRNASSGWSVSASMTFVFVLLSKTLHYLCNSLKNTRELFRPVTLRGQKKMIEKLVYFLLILTFLIKRLYAERFMGQKTYDPKMSVLMQTFLMSGSLMAHIFFVLGALVCLHDTEWYGTVRCGRPAAFMWLCNPHTIEDHVLYVCMVTHIARVWINRVRLPVLHVVS